MQKSILICEQQKGTFIDEENKKSATEVVKRKPT
jgi:hypothetical protein